MQRAAEFDGPAFARALVERRRRLGFSTRDVAKLAGISQPYVVALEHPGGPGGRRGPTPTVDVVAGLAHALRVDPTELFAAALRPAGHHVLLVVDGDQRTPLEHALRAVTDQVDTWVYAPAPSLAKDRVVVDDHQVISLHRNRAGNYEASQVARTLGAELTRLDGAVGGGLAGRRLGLVFDEMSEVLSTLAEPDRVVAFEYQWAVTVTTAARAVGSYAAWNICAYRLDALQKLDHPLDSTLELIRSHDTVWAAFDDKLIAGQRGARRLLDRLRPATVSRKAWAAATAAQLSGVPVA